MEDTYKTEDYDYEYDRLHWEDKYKVEDCDRGCDRYSDSGSDFYFEEDCNEPWWKDYDGDIEEEKYKIEERILREIKDPEEQLDKIQLELEKLEYNEYFAYNPHFFNDYRLSVLRDKLKRDVPENIKTHDFITYILDKSQMYNCSDSHSENILIVNVNKKFTFLNSLKKIKDYYKMIERGLAKMKREYGDEWKEGDEKIYITTPVALKKCLYY